MEKTLYEYFPKWLKFHAAHLEIVKESLKDWSIISLNKEILASTNRPLAIVFDIDEVLVSSFPWNFQPTSQFFPNYNGKYCPAYSNAVDVIKECRTLGLTIFFITARTNTYRNETIENINYLNLVPDFLITMPEGQDPKIYKTESRKNISNNFRIIASIGDQLSDLGDYTDINYLIPNPFYKSSSSSN